MIQNFNDYLNEANGFSITLNATSSSKNVVYPLMPAMDYMSESGVIVGGVWTINTRADMNKARTLVKSLGLNIVNDLDDILNDAETNKLWEKGLGFVYFFSVLSKEVNAYVLGENGVMPLK